jgi:L-rhamnose isomerase/sugar isomerase
VQPTLAAWRESKGLPANPLAAHRSSDYTEIAARERTARREASGQTAGSSYA